MKYLSRRDIEQISRRVVRAYKQLPEVAAAEFLYIDPEVLVRALLGLDLEYRHLSNDGLTLGLTSFEEVGVQLFDTNEGELYFLDGKTILVERDLHTDPGQCGRCNFTVMHEAGHQILKMLFPRDYGGVNARKVICLRQDSAQKAMGDWDEWQANVLASYVLMPPELIHKAMGYAGLSGKIKMLNRIWRQDEYNRFVNVSEILGVSKKALAIRMKQLDLLGEEFLAHPNKILDIEMEDREYV